MRLLDNNRLANVRLFIGLTMIFFSFCVKKQSNNGICKLEFANLNAKNAVFLTVSMT